MDKLFGALSLARRAGALVAGFDAVMDDVKRRRAGVVLLAHDLSEKTASRVRRACEGRCPVVALPYTQDRLAAITAKPVGVLAVTNKDLAALCLREGTGKEEPV